jgi:cytoskeletal protein CcmA (bactofilin family)
VSNDLNGFADFTVNAITKPTNGLHPPDEVAPTPLYQPDPPTTDHLNSIQPTSNLFLRPEPSLANVRAPVRNPEVSIKPPEGGLIACAGLKLEGKIKACSTLRVEGEIEGQARARELVIVDGGSFIGTAEVTEAEIAGRFEGTLRVSGKLMIRRSGRVKGEVSYSQLEIEPGGELHGRVDVQSRNERANIRNTQNGAKSWLWSFRSQNGK